MSTSLSPSTKESYSDSFRERTLGAVALKDYATAKGLNIPDAILKIINEAHLIADEQRQPPDSVAVRLDEAIRDLSRITYPTTAETLLFTAQRGRTLSRRLASRYMLPLIALISIVIAIWSFGQIQQSRYSASILAASLGLLGALVYQLFNLIGVIEERAINAEDAYANFIRIILGPIVGWIFYFAFAQSAYAQTSAPASETSRGNLLLLIVPFLAGFSTKLVVGVINQVISAVELTLGVEDKRNDILIRKRKNKDDRTRT